MYVASIGLRKFLMDFWTLPRYLMRVLMNSWTPPRRFRDRTKKISRQIISFRATLTIAREIFFLQTCYHAHRNL